MEIGGYFDPEFWENQIPPVKLTRLEIVTRIFLQFSPKNRYNSMVFPSRAGFPNKSSNFQTFRQPPTVPSHLKVTDHQSPPMKVPLSPSHSPYSSPLSRHANPATSRSIETLRSARCVRASPVRRTRKSQRRKTSSLALNIFLSRLPYINYFLSHNYGSLYFENGPGPGSPSLV